MTTAEKLRTEELGRTFPRLVTFPELRALGVPYSRRQLDRKELEGTFPKRVPLGEGKVAWITSEVIAFVDMRIAARSIAAGTIGSATIDKRDRIIKPIRVAPLLGKQAPLARTRRAG